MSGLSSGRTPDPRAGATSSTICRLVRSGRVWLCDDDLAVSRVPTYALAHDARGVLWLGSEDGPVLFDGLVWSGPAGLAALSGCMVKTLASTPDNTMWLGTWNAGLACLDLGALPYRVLARMTQADGLPGNSMRALHVDPHGQLWAATDGGVVVIHAGAVRQHLTIADGLPSDDVWSLCGDSEGRIWVGTAEGLAVIADGAVTAYLGAATAIPAGGVQALCHDPAGHIWIGMRNGAVLRADARCRSGPVFHPVHTCDARVRALCPDRRGRLWVGTSAGVLLLENDAVRDAFTMDDGLPTKEVWALCCDSEERIWASTSTGLTLIENAPSPVRALPGSADLLRTPIAAFAPARGGRMWVGGEAGVSVLDGVSEAPAGVPALPAGMARDAVWVLRMDQQGYLWAGGPQRDSLICVDPESGALRAHITTAKKAVPALCLVGERQLWAGTSGQGLLCVDTQTYDVIHQIGVADGLPHAMVQGMQTDQQGRLWVGTWSGWVACIDPEAGLVLHTLCLHDDTTDHFVSDIARDASGLLWAAVYGVGLVCVDPVRGVMVRVVTTAEGLPSNLVYACHGDAQGHLWVGTRRGVARYTPQTKQCVVLGRGMGLPREECVSRGLAMDGQNQLWVGTVQGVGLIDTSKIAAVVPPSPVYLTGLTVMGHVREVRPGLEIEDSDYDLLFEYGATAFMGAHQMVYRVQLVGLDTEWSAPTSHRGARYTTLRPGDYTFRVAARNWGGQWSAPLEAPFRVIRNRTAREMDDALERERIATDVYRATAARLTELNRQLEETDRLKTALLAQIQAQAALFKRLSLHDGLTGLLNRRALDARLAEEFARGQRDGRPLTVVLADIDHFKRVNDTYGHQVGDRVLQVVARLCRDHKRAGDSIGRYGGEEIALILPATTALEGVVLCERLRRAVERYAWDGIAAGLRVTLSLGVSGWREAPHHEKMLTDADRYLYQAKHTGRNRTYSAADPAVTHQAPDADAPCARPGAYELVKK